MGRFDRKVALITGAASGIGRAVTLRLAEEGATVFATDIDGFQLEETVELGGRAVTGQQADVTDPAAVGELVAACAAALGRLDVVGNIAGIARGEHFLEVTPERYRQMMSVNVDACFYVAQASIPHLLETSGNLINMASNAGLMGQAYTVAYCMSKGAIVQMTRSLAMEFAKTPLRVNAIAPGGVETPLVRGYQAPGDIDLELLQPYIGFRGMAQADEVAGLFAYLASEEARSVHGAILSLDNGLTAG
jgi:NAD(P)-dependent dehydrogenase (short-subunit alcohol dehydrogenase family)